MRRGAWGEAAAATFLEKQGYCMVARNVTVRGGEIDLIAQQGRFLVFVEVKTRRSDKFSHACEAVDAAKQRRLILTAQHWLSTHPTSLQPRFDVIEVYGSEHDPAHRIHHIQNAFDG